MRTVAHDSYSKISAPETLWNAFKSCRSSKRRTPAMAKFELNADRNIILLSKALRDFNYKTSPYRLKIIYDPKKRLISAPSVKDRIVQRAIIDVMGPTYERSFHPFHFACGQGRGPHRACLLALKQNRRFKYRLHLDIRRYFLSIDRNILLSLFGKKLKDSRTLELIKMHLTEGSYVYRSAFAIDALKLDEHPLPSPNAGIAIGAYLSQWSGAFYLNELDHYISRTLKIPGYMRYMDDLLLFQQSEDQLWEAKAVIERWLQEYRYLQLNPKHNVVEPTARAFVYLGYRISRGGVDVSSKLKRRFCRNIRKSGMLGGDNLQRSLASYKGLLMFGC